jgi:hypothetical protein
VADDGTLFVGFNTGRWDYINNVSDALTWDPSFINPNIDAVVMTYGYMRTYEDGVRRVVDTGRSARSVRPLAGRHGAEHSSRLGSVLSRPESGTGHVQETIR